MKKALKTKLTQERIIEAALIEFSKKGYKAFGINELCKNHGISKGVLYHNFSGKTDLYLACVRKSFQKAVSFIRGETDEVPSLADYMERRDCFYKEFPEYSHVFFEALLMAPPEIAEAIQKERTVFEHLNEQVSEKLLTESKLKKGVSHSEALTYLAFIQQLFRGYYLLAESDNNLSNFAKKYETDLNRVLEMMIYGILEDKKQ